MNDKNNEKEMCERNNKDKRNKYPHVRTKR